jgi:hypothetical protein
MTYNVSTIVGLGARMKLALNIATRNRPKLLYDTVMATLANVRHRDTVLMVSADADDGATLDFFQTLPLTVRDRLLISVEPSEDTVGAKWNRVLAAVPDADVYMPITDDGPITTPGFDEKILEAAAIFPDGIGVVYSRMENFSLPALQAVTRRLAELMGGQICVTHFPYWFVDAWLDDIAKLIDRVAFADVDAQQWTRTASWGDPDVDSNPVAGELRGNPRARPPAGPTGAIVLPWRVDRMPQEAGVVGVGNADDGKA